MNGGMNNVQPGLNQLDYRFIVSKMQLYMHTRLALLYLLIIHWDISITGFVIQELDSVQFLHDIIFCFESDSIVVFFSSRTGFLRADVV